MGPRLWRSAVVCLLSFLLLSLLGGARPAAADGAHVDVLTVDGVINPVTAGYIARGIRAAERDGAACLVIRLDTPGGLSSSTEEIVRSILNAQVPVVVYVWPRGGRAASAGLYITYASHVAAMAPNTHIGAATPVAMGEGGQPTQLPQEMQDKLEQDALANLRASAQERGRNLEWAERAVRQAASATAREALDLHVVEILAEDLDDLLAQLDGRSVTLASGRSLTLHTAGAYAFDLPMNVLERFLLVITDPTIAYLLLSVGMLGLWVELSHPGVSLPGVLGGVCILMGLYGLGTLPVNWAGVFLILFAFILFGFDLFASTHAVLTIGGIVAFIMGSLVLFHSPEPYLRVEAWAIALVAGVILAIVILVVGAAIRGQRRPVVSGREALIGMAGVARQPLDPDGLVFVDGALWKAHAEGGAVPQGAQVEILALEGLLLRVRLRQEQR